MIEAWGDDFKQDLFIKAINYSALEAYKIVELIKSSVYTLKQTQKQIELPVLSQEQEANMVRLENEINIVNKDFFQEKPYNNLYATLTDYSHDKKSKDAALSLTRNSIINELLKSGSNDPQISAKLNDSFLRATLYNYQSLSELYSKFTKQCIRRLYVGYY